MFTKKHHSENQTEQNACEQRAEPATTDRRAVFAHYPLDQHVVNWALRQDNNGKKS